MNGTEVGFDNEKTLMSIERRLTEDSTGQEHRSRR